MKTSKTLYVMGMILMLAISALAQDRHVKSGYAPVNGLRMYYEIHGTGQPLVLLHGAYSAIGTSFGKLLPTPAKNWQVIAVELQGHGRTADLNRPITYEQMADDVAALLRHLKIDRADIFGYSMGEGVYPEVWAMISTITAEIFEGSPFKSEYDSLAPSPQHWPKLVKN